MRIFTVTLLAALAVLPARAFAQGGGFAIGPRVTFVRGSEDLPESSRRFVGAAMRLGGGRSADEAKQAAQQVAAKADAIDKASRKLVYEVVLSEAQGGFKFGRATLPDEAKAQLDKLVTDISADPKNVFFEIEGHTDSAGSAKYNEALGQERADSVKLYLYETHKVPLHKINVISYGEAKPVAPNKTRDGRAQNRRVVVRVLS